MALSHEQLKDLEDNRRWLTQRAPQSNQRVASWLRELIPELDERRAAVAERMADDFEALAHRRRARPLLSADRELGIEFLWKGLEFFETALDGAHGK